MINTQTFDDAGPDAVTGTGAAGVSSTGPTVSGVHVDAPMGAYPLTDKRRRGAKQLTSAFLHKLREQLTGKAKGGEAITPDDFDVAVKHARAHAGGMGKAANRVAASWEGSDQTVRQDAPHGTNYLTPVSEPDSPHKATTEGLVYSPRAVKHILEAAIDIDAGQPHTMQSQQHHNVCMCGTGCGAIGEYDEDCSCPPGCPQCSQCPACNDDLDLVGEDTGEGDVEPDRDADDLPGLEKADERVNYRPAENVGQQCAECRFMVEHNECVIVEGYIDPMSVCNLFAAKLPGGTTAVAGSDGISMNDESKQFNWDKWNAAHHEASNVEKAGEGYPQPKPGDSPHVSAHAVGDQLPYVLPSKKLGHAELRRKIPNGEEWRVHNEKGSYVYTSGFKDVQAHHPDQQQPKKHVEEFVELGAACAVCPTALTERACIEHPNGWALFSELGSFAEAPARIPLLPKPGIYKSEKYGQVRISPERNQRFVANMNAGVYQQFVPIDAEHQTKLSGAMGWIRGAVINSDQSVDGVVEWTDRGRSMVEADRFRYISPEFYDEWADPKDGTKYKDVIIGAALTTRPFFKEKNLRSLVMSESGTLLIKGFTEEEMDRLGIQAQETTHEGGTIMAKDPHNDDEEMKGQMDADGDYDGDENDKEDQDTKKGGKKDMTETVQLTELQAALQMRERENEALTTMNRQMAERVGALENASRRKRFTETVMGRDAEGDGAQWPDSVEENVRFLETLADSFSEGENDAQFASYVTRQRALAARMKASKLFDEVGSDHEKEATAPSSLYEQMEQVAQERMTAGHAKNFAEGFVQAAELHPDWAQKYAEEVRSAHGTTTHRG